MDQVLLAVLLLAFIVGGIVIAKNPKAVAFIKGKLSSGSGSLDLKKICTHSAFIVFVGIVMTCAAIAWLLPTIWDKFLWGDKIVLAWLVIGVPFLVFLRSIKDSAGKPKPVAAGFAKVFQWVLIIGLGWTILQNPYWKGNWSLWPFGTEVQASISSGSNASTPYYGNYHFDAADLPAEVALPEIAKCETPGGRHYEDDGKTLYKNRDNPPSTARGKYQFLESHWAEALKLDPPLHLDVEAEYEKYATHLWNTVGSQHWEFNENKGGGRACWGKRLQELAEERGTRIKPGPNEVDLRYVTAGLDWTEPYVRPSLPPGARLFNDSVNGTCYDRMLNRDQKQVYGCKDDSHGPPARIYSFRSQNGNVRIRIYYTVP